MRTYDGTHPVHFIRIHAHVKTLKQIISGVEAKHFPLQTNLFFFNLYGGYYGPQGCQPSTMFSGKGSKPGLDASREARLKPASISSPAHKWSLFPQQRNKLFRNRVCFAGGETNSTVVAWVCFPPGETNSAQSA